MAPAHAHTPTTKLPKISMMQCVNITTITIHHIANVMMAQARRITTSVKTTPIAPPKSIVNRQIAIDYRHAVDVVVGLLLVFRL